MNFVNTGKNRILKFYTHFITLIYKDLRIEEELPSFNVGFELEFRNNSTTLLHTPPQNRRFNTLLVNSVNKSNIITIY